MKFAEHPPPFSDLHTVSILAFAITHISFFPLLFFSSFLCPFLYFFSCKFFDGFSKILFVWLVIYFLFEIFSQKFALAFGVWVGEECGEDLVIEDDAYKGDGEGEGCEHERDCIDD